MLLFGVLLGDSPFRDNIFCALHPLKCHFSLSFFFLMLFIKYVCDPLGRIIDLCIVLI